MNATTRAKSSFSQAPRRDRRSNRIRAEALPKRQDFSLESLESRLLLSVDLLGSSAIWTDLGPGVITNAANVDLTGNNNPTGTPFRTGDAGDIDGGAIEAVAVDPNNAAHVAIGAVNGGVWVTGNINAAPPAWTTNGDQLPSLAISAVAFSPTNGNIIYAGTGSYTNGAVGFHAGVTNPASVTTAGSGGDEGFIYRSTDGGASWTVIDNSLFDGLRIRDIVPTTLNGGQTVFVGTTDVNGPNTGGVYRSDDSGVTWTRLSGAGANGLPNQGVTDLIADPNNPNRFFTAVPNGAGAGVYVLDTTGGNTTWTNVTGNLPAGALAGQRILLSISTAGAHPIWAGVINNAGFLQGVYRGLEGGGTVAWTAVGPGGLPPDIYGLPSPQGATNFSLVADPNQDNFVYVGGDAKNPFPFAGNLARGDSTAQTWTAISTLGTASAQVGVTLPLAGANPATTAPHSDSRNMVFDGNNIIEVNDGGIYLLTNPTGAAAPAWSSLHGNLQVGEVYQAAIDTLNTAMTTDDVYIDAQQDDGANERSTAGAWQEAAGGDGTIVLTDSVNGHRYFSTQNFSLLRRDGGGALVIPAGTITNAGAIAGLSLNGATPATTPKVEVMPFLTVAVLNGSNPNRMLVGGNTTLYESTDNANTFRSIGGLNGAGNGALGIAGLTGIVTAIAYGNTANANLAYVADAAGNLLMTTNITAAGGGFVATDFNVVAGGNAALGIVVDPNNGNIAYAVTNIGVFRTTNGTNWTSITDNILQIAQSGGRNTLASIALFNNGTATNSDDVLLVGGLGGVFRRAVSAAPNPNSNWIEYGAELPNVLVTSLTYNSQSDSLLAGTYGRSNWTLADVTDTISVPGILQIFGDEDFVPEDDTIILVRDAANTSLLDVFINGILEEQVQLSLIQQINVDSLGGNDTLVVDSSNGLINVQLGIRYHGGDGFDSLQLLQTGGPTQTSDTYSVGPALGSGTSMIVGTGTQTVFFEDLEPVLDLVPSASLIVNATATDNAISYFLQSVSGNGLVTIDEHESIEFANKTALTIDARAGQDTISVNNPSTPAGLTGITIIGGDPSSGDTLNITGAGRAVTVDTALRTIDGATGTGANPVSIHFDNPVTIENLNLLAGIGNLTINTTGADDTAVVTPGVDPGGANSGTVQSSGAVPQITFVNSGTFTANLGGGDDALVVNGSSNVVTGDTVAVSGSQVAISGRRTVILSDVEALTVNGNAGSDTFNVTPSPAVAIFIDGGDPVGVKPGDLININAGSDPVTFNAGPENDEGSLEVGANQPVSFDHIESVAITGGGPAVINGTNGPDAITVIARDKSTHAGTDGVQDFTVSVNNGTELLFINQGALTINALSGSDQVTLRTPAPNNAVWDVDVTVDGGPPAADTDRLIVETPGPEAEIVDYRPDLGTLDLASLSSLVTITDIESLTYDGQGDNDILTIFGTGGDDTIVHIPGANDQAGSFQVNSLLAFSYQNLGSGAILTVNGNGGTDELVYNGTAANDTFTIGGTVAGTADDVKLNSRLVVNTTGVQVLTLRGFAGDDTFTLVPAISASVYATINLDGGGQASATGDRVNLVGTALNDDIVISGQVVSLGGVTINSSGIEDILLDALGGTTDSITYNGVSGVTENITVSSSGTAGGGQVSVPGVTLVDFRNVERILVNGNVPGPTDADTLTFAGTNAVDTFNINLAAAGTSADPILKLQNGSTLLTLENYTNFNTLNVQGLDGADTFNVYTAATGPNRNVHIDGGQPTAKKKSTDNLNVFYTGQRPRIIQSTATQNPTSGLVDLDYGTARFVVQYDDIEQVVIRKN